ncbi:MAG TPA: hypothetical protein QGF35_03310 [Dehalococcoidia bacterium]|nr:hypothetical protein [Dehalococcoidia bacterium]
MATLEEHLANLAEAFDSAYMDELRLPSGSWETNPAASGDGEET